MTCVCYEDRDHLCKVLWTSQDVTVSLGEPWSSLPLGSADYLILSFPSAHLLERLELNSMLGLMVLCLFGFFSLFKNWPYNRNGNPLQYSCLENSMDKRRLVGYSPWGGKESDMTERLTLSTS